MRVPAYTDYSARDWGSPMLRVGILCLALCAGFVITAEIMEHYEAFIMGPHITNFGALFLWMIVLSFWGGMALSVAGLIQWLVRKYR